MMLTADRALKRLKAGNARFVAGRTRFPTVVMGHESCGAVQAALATRFAGAAQKSRIALLLIGAVYDLETGRVRFLK
jgi:carbonic anhydrase